MMILTASATAPSNMNSYNKKIANFVQKDMYPTDVIYGKIFEFSDSYSPIELFEDMGYEGANFLSLSGSLIINLIISSLTLLYKSVMLYFSKKLYMYERVREYGIAN
jgi:hypothetical protein